MPQRNTAAGTDKTEKTEKRGISLRWSLTLVIFLCWVLPILVVVSVSSAVVYRGTRQHVADILSISISNEAANLRRGLNTVVEKAVEVSYVPTVRNAYQNFLQDGNKVSLYNDCQALLSQQFSRSGLIHSAYLLFPQLPLDDTERFYTHNATSTLPAQAREFYANGASEAALAMMPTLDTDIGFLQADGRLYLVRNLSLRQNRYEPYALLAIELNQDALFEGMENMTWVSSAVVYVNELPIYTVGGEALPTAGDLAGAPSATRVQDDTLSFSAASAAGRYRFLCRVEADMRPMMQAASGSVNLVFFIALLGIPLMALVLLFFMRRVNRPITALSRLAGQIEAGQFGAQTDTSRFGSAEFTYLGRQMNAMSAKLQGQFELLYREELALRDARIKALQSQINPHFLGNTLEIINWEARLAGNVKVSQMMEALATILQATQGRDQRPLVHLSEEMMYVNAYLYIIGRRLGKRLQVKQEIDPALMDWYVPRLILQPLVENAVEHGVGARPKGTITIRAFLLKDGWMQLEVENDSPMSHEDAENVRRLLAEEERPGERSTNIGIRNVHQRLRILYGEHSGLLIETTKNGCTVSSMCIRETQGPQDMSK